MKTEVKYVTITSEQLEGLSLAPWESLLLAMGATSLSLGFTRILSTHNGWWSLFCGLGAVLLLIPSQRFKRRSRRILAELRTQEEGASLMVARLSPTPVRRDGHPIAGLVDDVAGSHEGLVDDGGSLSGLVDDEEGKD